MPYNRIEGHFEDQLNIPISPGSVYNFNLEAYELLNDFEKTVKAELINSDLIHNDETGININRKKYWIHLPSNEFWTYYFPYKKRGKDAIDEMGILPNFKGTFCHDHWKPYYNFPCAHALCNAHHARELERAIEEDNQKWADKMKNLLYEINEKVSLSGRVLSKTRNGLEKCKRTFKRLFM